MSPIQQTIKISELTKAIEDPTRGVFSLVGDRGGLSQITGEVYLSNVVIGHLAVETEHGTTYLDLDADALVNESAPKGFIVIERQYDKHLVIAYVDQAQADRAMADSLFIDGLCQRDCLDAYTSNCIPSHVDEYELVRQPPHEDDDDADHLVIAYAYTSECIPSPVDEHELVRPPREDDDNDNC